MRPRGLATEAFHRETTPLLSRIFGGLFGRRTTCTAEPALCTGYSVETGALA
jgi:hypothetical protein